MRPCLGYKCERISLYRKTILYVFFTLSTLFPYLWLMATHDQIRKLEDIARQRARDGQSMDLQGLNLSEQAKVKASYDSMNMWRTKTEEPTYPSYKGGDNLSPSYNEPQKYTYTPPVESDDKEQSTGTIIFSILYPLALAIIGGLILGKVLSFIDREFLM